MKIEYLSNCRWLTYKSSTKQYNFHFSIILLDEEAGKSDQSGQDSYVVIEDDRITKILVSGLPAAVDEDYLELLFEKCGGSVNSVEIDREESTAVIEFDDPDGMVS